MGTRVVSRRRLHGYSQSSYGVRSKWLKDDDLIYPCNAVVQRAKYQCYLIQLARIGPALGFDWQRIAATCRESEPEFVVVCFQSIGREASGFTRAQLGGHPGHLSVRR